MWKITEVILVIFLVLSLTAGVNLYMVNQQLPDGCMAVFSFQKYIDRLVSLDFPDYDLFTFISSVNNVEDDSIMTFDEVRAVVAPFVSSVGIGTPVNIVSSLQRYRYYSLYNLAQQAIDGDYSGSISYDGCVYTPVVGNYTVYNDVLFSVTVDIEDSSGFINRIVYTVKYIFLCFKTVFRFSKNLLPFNCYEFVYYVS